MKKDQVKVGGLYAAKVSDKLVTVRIDSAHSGGGWNATNTATGKRIRIKSAQRLRRAVKDRSAAGEAPEEKTPAAAEDALKTTKKAKAKKSEPKPKRVGALDAAAQVLKAAGQPMRAQELIAAMAEQGLWSSPAGKTPHATLYAAMMREARDKGTESRFRKVDRGMFEYASK